MTRPCRAPRRVPPWGDASPAPVFAAGGRQEDRPPPAQRSPLPTPGRSWRGSAGNRPCGLLAGLFLIRRTSGRRVCSDSLSWAARISRSCSRCSGSPCAGRRGGGGGASPDHTLSLASPCSGGFLGTRRHGPGKVSGRRPGQFGSGKQEKYSFHFQTAVGEAWAFFQRTDVRESADAFCSFVRRWGVRVGG